MKPFKTFHVGIKFDILMFHEIGLNTVVSTFGQRVSMERFQVGDVVSLKIDSPKMLVDQINGSIITCVWFDGYSRQEGTFDAANLKKEGDQLRQAGVW